MLSVFKHPDFDKHEHVSFFHDPESGLRAIIAIHSTVLGPAGGGCRMYPYASEEDAIRDVLRLSKAMTYKLALAGFPAGGGKTVVIGDPAKDKSEALLRALGRAVDRLGGLKSLEELDEYCFYVAGVVGEMLTELFCLHSEKIAEKREELMPLSISFGQALQMTNILKDIWDDANRSVCWLPSEVFEKHGYDLKNLHLRQPDAGFEAAMLELLDIAQGYLAESLDYVCLLPPEETGIRRFCLYALGMSVLTLQKIRQNPRFTNAEDVKISRETVQEVVQKVNEICGDNEKLRAAFAAMCLG